MNDTIVLAMALDPADGPDVCRLCGGPLPKIPFEWVGRLLAGS